MLMDVADDKRRSRADMLKAMGLAGEGLRAAVAELLAHAHDGMSDDQAREEMGLTFEEYDALKEEMYEREETRLRSRSSAQAYVDYVNAQQACIRDLHHLLGRLEDSRQFTASVGAIRAMSDIHDKIVAKGQEFGLIEKKADEKKITLGGRVDVGSLDLDGLRKLVAKEIRATKDLMERFGDGDIIDIDPGELHRDLPLELPPAETTPRGKVHKGRRVVKTGIEAS